MFKDLKKQIFYAGRGLFRDNLVCRQMVKTLRRNEHLSSRETADMQSALLLRSLRVAARRLPFYQRYADRIDRLAPDEASAFLREALPIVTKEHLLNERERFYPRAGRVSPWSIVGRTSGTTGTPLDVVRSARSVLWANAFKKRHWTWSGYEDGMPRASLRGDFVVAPERTTPPFWFHDRYSHQLILSSRHLKPAFLPALADALERFAPFLLEAYPSTAYELALHLRRMNRVVRIPFVYTGSEPLYPHQRSAIEQSFATQVMDHYGMAERVAYATECEQGELHLNSDYSFVEIVDDRGRPTADYGYIVGTTFHNLAMPLIRYRLSDMAKWKNRDCACGRRYPTIEPVTGKYEDFLWGSDGVPVSPSVVTFAFKEIKNIRRSQVAQVGAGKWQVRLIPAEDFSSADTQQLIANIKKLVDPKLDVTAVLLNDIPRTAAGKYKWVVNEWRNGARDRAIDDGP
jgi:phenylacetate-coenzyme A ligase PaaK-like adenylate-forming protein